MPKMWIFPCASEFAKMREMCNNFHKPILGHFLQRFKQILEEHYKRYNVCVFNYYRFKSHMGNKKRKFNHCENYRML